MSLNIFYKFLLTSLSPTIFLAGVIQIEWALTNLLTLLRQLISFVQFGSNAKPDDKLTQPAILFVLKWWVKQTAANQLLRTLTFIHSII